MAKDLKGKQLPKGIIQRPDGRYMGRFTFAGERYTLYENKSPAKLKKAMEDMRYELEHGLRGKTKKINLDNFFKIWISEKQTDGVKETTVMLYSNYYRWYIQNKLGKKLIVDITKNNIKEIIKDMETGTKTCTQKSVSTIRKTYSIIYDIMNFAVSENIIMTNPCVGIKLPKEKKSERRVMDSEEQKILLDAIKGSYYEDFYIIALGTGMRINEILALTWDDIDYDENKIHVNKTLAYIQEEKGEHGYLQFQDPKTDAGIRDIPFLPGVKECFKKHKIKQDTQRMKVANLWKSTAGMENLVFTTETGSPINSQYIRKNMNYIVKKINKEEARKAALENRDPKIFEHITPHALRHSFATRAFESGMKPKTVQEILGHSSLSMTMDLYTHVTDNIKEEEMQKMKNTI